MGRKLKQPEYKRFRYSKRIKHDGPKLSSGWKLFRQSLALLKQNWRLFGGITLVYGLLTVVLVRGLGRNIDLVSLKESNSFSAFGTLLGSSGDGVSQSASVYQLAVLVITSLSLIWALRQISGEAKTRAIKVKDTFYKSMSPLVPFLLVVGIISIQLVPMAIGASIYGLVTSNGLAVGIAERFIWLGLFLLLAAWSIYMLSSSIFAAYVVTLPGMTPLKALRSARKLVRYRRWTIIRKVLFLPLIILVTLAIIMLPIIIIVPPIAEWCFFAVGLIVLPVVHAYFYTLYREML